MVCKITTSPGQVTACVERCCACRYRHSEVWPRPGSDTARRTSMARRPRPGVFQAGSDSSPVSLVGRLRSGRLCRHSAAPTFRQPSTACSLATGSTLTAVGPFQLPGSKSPTLFQILPGTRPSVKTISDVCLKHTCSLDTSAVSALEVLDDDRAL